MAGRLAMMRKNWSNFAVVFTETANKHMTLQCAQQLHCHMQLDRAQNVLEIAAGAGLGSLDAAQYLFDGGSKLRTFTVTDLSPVMVGMAKENFNGVDSRGVDIQFTEANGKLELQKLRKCYDTLIDVHRPGLGNCDGFDGSIHCQSVSSTRSRSRCHAA
ncbi:hypothetical protein PPTG_19176 [Phytophthora nicotianae INRA-310]|uniref:Methyltransferase domain-containing protein n=1 Tax=Phytophthora nicotianae (strain INRA-310) TaxID=761204 RepID=W2PFH5_PHYN3|nr:hypothetical protein PPTG_19176 [Phytophthora nicotianae INRA-310]ETM98968.1 hypothetical protein PPTG_19176 [Phytophthora nicotianae INRA-310]